MIDIHCHVLPGLDDGPAGMPEALAMAGAFVASGTSALVATPHIDHTWRVRPQLIPPRAAALREALAAEGIELQISTGAEIALSRVADLTPDEVVMQQPTKPKRDKSGRSRNRRHGRKR